MFDVSNSHMRGRLRTYGRRAERERAAALDALAGPRTVISMAADGTAQWTTTSHSRVSERPQTPTDLPTAAKTSKLPSTPAIGLPPSSTGSSPLSPSENPFSDPQTKRSMSPPSSPPVVLKLTPPPSKPHKPAFNFLKRKRKALSNATTVTSTATTATSTGRALADASASTTNARSGPVATSDEPVKKKLKKPQSWTQMRLDLGGSTTRACAECGMEYVPSNSEDATLHRRFHEKKMRSRGGERGIDMGRGFALELDGVSVARRDASIVLVDAEKGSATRRKTMAALEVVNAELGSVDISEEALWGAKNAKRKKSQGKGSDREFKVFMYCVKDACVGLCLAERISKASRVVDLGAPGDLPKAPGVRSSSIQTEPSDEPVLLGISRIWTAKAYRGKGIALDLLDHARSRFFYGIEVAREMVAFSQPTESGGLLAERWFGAPAGWHVYEPVN